MQNSGSLQGLAKQNLIPAHIQVEEMLYQSQQTHQSNNTAQSSRSMDTPTA
jgi:hypothetical protein